MFASGKLNHFSVSVSLVLLFGGLSLFAQTTAFSYQGKLSDGGAPANGQYDFTFKLFDALSGGTQSGSEIVRNDVDVIAGLFTVTLDFGSSPFTSFTGNYLEISVRPGASTGAYTTLSPRQAINSSPYSISTIRAAAADALSSSCVACVTNSQIESLSASKITGQIPVSAIPPGSGSYIQNQSGATQTASLNISGNGTFGGAVSATSFVGNGSGLTNVAAVSAATLLCVSCINSDHIVDGTITNSDINASAAIAPTKISGTAAILGANAFTANQSITGDLNVSGTITAQKFSGENLQVRVNIGPLPACDATTYGMLWLAYDSMSGQDDLHVCRIDSTGYDWDAL